MKTLYSTSKTISSVVGILGMIVIFSSNAYGLGWADREWISSGCPSNILGSWKPRSSPDKVPHEMKIQRGVISLITAGEGEEKFFYGESKFIKEARFLQFNVTKDNIGSQSSAVWKIRPHLTWKPNSQSKSDVNSPDCLIKVLRFENEKQARFDKYQSWDIYEKLSN